MKIDMGQKLVSLPDGDNIARSTSLHGDTLMQALRAVHSVSLDAGDMEKVVTAFNALGAEPLTLAVACVNGLLTPTQDDKPDGAERLRRMNLAQRLNRKGMVKIDEVEADYVVKCAEKVYPSAMITVQMKTLLSGKAFFTSMPEEEDVPALAPEKG